MHFRRYSQFWYLLAQLGLILSELVIGKLQVEVFIGGD